MTPHRSRQVRALLRRVPGILALTALLPALGAAAAPTPSSSPSSSSSTPGLGIAGAFGLAPAPNSLGQEAGYFQLAVAPGHSIAAAAVVYNLADTAKTLLIGRSAGVTATNGGSAYLPASSKCSGPSCWVTGLPSKVTLPAHAREQLYFTVSVPAGTAPGQYLSGIAVEPAARPRPVKVGSNGSASAGAVIIEDVTVGVAVTVGNPSTFVTRLAVAAVQGTMVGQDARLSLQVDNTGQTFAKGKGTASCTAGGKRQSYAVDAGTILPGDDALIAVNASGLPRGVAIPCSAQLHYGKDQTVRWAGTVTIPAPSSARIVHTGNGTYAEIPQPGIPTWAIALIVLGVLLLAGLAFLFYRVYRPRGADSPRTEHPSG
jgi:hypothetical protein